MHQIKPRAVPSAMNAGGRGAWPDRGIDLAKALM
jgi:hypothetical protein